MKYLFEPINRREKFLSDVAEAAGTTIHEIMTNSMNTSTMLAKLNTLLSRSNYRMSFDEEIYGIPFPCIPWL